MKPEIDDYETCAETYATLRAYHQTEASSQFTEAVRIAPTKTQSVGETRQGSGRVRTIKLNGWFYSTKDTVASYDAQKHLLHLIEIFAARAEDLARLRESGWRMDISCYWDSAYGHGGPELSAETMRQLSELGVTLGWDVYFQASYELLREEKMGWAER